MGLNETHKRLVGWAKRVFVLRREMMSSSSHHVWEAVFLRQKGSFMVITLVNKSQTNSKNKNPPPIELSLDLWDKK